MNSDAPAKAAAYDVPEVAKALKTSEDHVREALKRGQIPGFKIGRLWRIPKVAFDKMLAGEAA